MLSVTIYGKRAEVSEALDETKVEACAYLVILVDVDVFAGEVRRWSGPDHDLDRFFFHHVWESLKNLD